MNLNYFGKSWEES